MNRFLLALVAIVLSCGSAIAQGNITVNGIGNTVTINQNRSYSYHYQQTTTNSFNSNSGNTNSFNGITNAVPPVVAYRTPCGKPPAQCCCQQKQQQQRVFVPIPREPRTMRLTYSRVTTTQEECWEWDYLCIKCWDPCGKFFRDTEERLWNLSQTSSPVPVSDRLKKLQGRLWTDSDGRLRFTASWVCPRTGDVVATRTFIDP